MAKLYPAFFKAVFTRMDAEKAHALGFAAIRACRASGVSRILRRITAPDPSLRTEAMGLTFPSPFGLAAGFDKGATGINALTDLGFGHVEVGTVTGRPQPGNPRPRLHRLITDKAVINRMGFNNDGADQIGPRLAAAHADLWHDYERGTRPIVGVNIGKTKVVPVDEAIDDYLHSTRTLAPQADYLAVNVSSPNTPGLRDLQHVDALRPLLSAVSEEADKAAGRHVPVLVKIAPDLSDEDIAAIADLAVELGLEGIIATNTTIRREGLGLRSTTEEIESCGAGGLSGKPVAARSSEVLAMVRERVGPDMTIISVGGVTSGDDVAERLRQGATLVQGYTAFLYEGPFWAATINRRLKKQMKHRGH